jgi:hypothetical protein
LILASYRLLLTNYRFIVVRSPDRLVERFVS